MTLARAAIAIGAECVPHAGGRAMIVRVGEGCADQRSTIFKRVSARVAAARVSEAAPKSDEAMR